MKKIFLISLVAFWAFTNVKAQGISFGIRAIPTFNWATVTDTSANLNYTNDGTKLGMGFGPSIRYKMSDNFNVDISGIFTWQKMGINIKNDPIHNNVVTNLAEKYKMQFLQIPLNLNGQFDVADDFQALLNFGVGAGILLKSSRQVIDNENLGAYPSTYDTRIKMLRFIDFYLTAGAGVVYNLEDNLHLSLTVQYNNGIIDGWADDSNTIYETSTKITTPLDIKHKNIALSLAFYIDL